MNKKQLVKKPFQYMLDEDKADALCPPDCVVLAMQGYSRFEDFYLFVPAKGFYTRTANSSRYGEWCSELFIDGDFVGGIPMRRVDGAKRLYEAGEVDEAKEYALGHRLWRETILGGQHINRFKEAARISHRLCDATGSRGHELRQLIRTKIRG